jgi:hypothetical protein
LQAVQKTLPAHFVEEAKDNASIQVFVVVVVDRAVVRIAVGNGDGIIKAAAE